jgi:hypothetical protein
MGKSMIFAATGDRIEFNYDDGVINGKAVISGSNGDKEICSYVDGVKHGQEREILTNSERNFDCRGGWKEFAAVSVVLRVPFV